MNRLARVELLKLATTRALPVSLAIAVGLTVTSVISNIALAGQKGMAPLGTVDNVNKVLSIAALTTMVALALGIFSIAGEYRFRTIVTSFLGEPRRERVLMAKLVVVAALGAVVGAVCFGLALAVAVPMYAAKGVHDLGVNVPQLWLGATIASACFGLLGVALGALTRNTVGAVIGAVIWVQIVEVSILQPAVPAVAKWLPTGAGVALTSSGSSDAADLLSPGVAAVVLVVWAVALGAVASRVALAREVQ